jgi:glutaredoxin
MKGLLLGASTFAALLAATAAGAQTIYKSINPDGSVVYSDKRPADGKIDKVIEFANLPSSPVPPLVVLPANQSRASNTHSAPMQNAQGARNAQWSTSTQPETRLSTRVESNAPRPEAVRPPPPPVTLYSAVWCGYCRRAKAYLAQHHIAYLDIDIDSSDGRAEFDGVGGGGVPLLMSGRKKVRGFKADGYDAFFAGRW